MARTMANGAGDAELEDPTGASLGSRGATELSTPDALRLVGAVGAVGSIDAHDTQASHCHTDSDDAARRVPARPRQCDAAALDRHG